MQTGDVGSKSLLVLALALALFSVPGSGRKLQPVERHFELKALDEIALQ